MAPDREPHDRAYVGLRSHDVRHPRERLRPRVGHRTRDGENFLAEAASGSGVGSEPRAMRAERTPQGQSPAVVPAAAPTEVPTTPPSRDAAPPPPHAPSTAMYRSRARAALRFVLQRVLFRGLVRSTITPSARIDPEVRGLRGGFLVVANHTSHLDAPLIAQSLPRGQARLLAAGVAYDYFFTAWHKRMFVRLLFNAFPVYREGSHGSSETPRALLRSGVPVLLFPEGGRQQNGFVADFKVGAIKLAVDTGAPIVPTAVVGGSEAMPKGTSWPVPGRRPVRVIVGAPVLAQPGESLPALTARVQCRVEELFDAGADELGLARLTHRRVPGDESGRTDRAPQPDKQGAAEKQATAAEQGTTDHATDEGTRT